VNDEQPVFGNYTQSQLNAQYDQRTLVPDLAPYIEHWTAAGEAARRSLECRRDVSYGEKASEKLDIFKPTTSRPAPIHVHIHGGGWRMLTKEHASFPAPVFVAMGACFVAIDHGSAKDTPLDEIVGQVRAAVAWVYKNADRFGGDRDTLLISGHSSGAHLAAMVLAQGWRAQSGLPADAIKGAVLASGSYDLEPVRLSARNDYLHLDVGGALRNSPIRHIPSDGPSICVAWGDGELEEFKRQGSAFAKAWELAGNDCETILCAGRNHFDMSNEFCIRDGPIIKAALRQMALADGATHRH
jgi:arylformamidase